MSFFVGYWECESSENFEEYLKELGVNAIYRKVAVRAKPRVRILNDGKKWTFITETPMKTVAVTGIEGQEFPESNSLQIKLENTFNFTFVVFDLLCLQSVRRR